MSVRVHKLRSSAKKSRCSSSNNNSNSNSNSNNNKPCSATNSCSKDKLALPVATPQMMTVKS